MRWVRKVRYPPLKVVELAVSVLAFYLYTHFYFLIDTFFLETYWVKSLGIVSNYLDTLIGSFILIAVFQAVISFLPRKLYTMDDKVVIKSLSYYSQHLAVNEIQSVSHVSPLRLLLTPGRLLKVWDSYFYFDPRFWKRGLLLELKSGKLYFFSTKDAGAAAVELQGLIQTQEKIEEHQEAA